MVFYQIGIFGALLALASPARIGPNLLQAMNSNPQGVHNIFISFNNTKPIPHILSQTGNSRQNRSEIATSVYLALKNNADRSQRDTINFLASEAARSVTYESFWITNKLYVTGADRELIRSLSRRRDVYEIRKEVFFKVLGEPSGVLSAEVMNQNVRGGVEWGIRKIRAPEVWQTGNTGEGVVIGVIDTGVNVNHEALRNNWIGPDYGWFDGVNGRSQPYDDGAHGTHVTGTLVGRGGIGVAPGSKFMACKGLAGSQGGEPGINRCFQFMACPTLSNGTQDCSKAPHIVNNSWGSVGSCYKCYDALRVWRKIGIIPVFAAGNSGPKCGTILSPGDSDLVISVGSTNWKNELARTSSVGPKFGTRKPDVSAPGDGIWSASNSSQNGYLQMSGTSMACPHVSGTIALIRSVNKDLGFDQIKDILEKTASKNLKSRGTNGGNCGGISDTDFPNNHFGHGLIDAYAAIRSIT